MMRKACASPERRPQIALRCAGLGAALVMGLSACSSAPPPVPPSAQQVQATAALRAGTQAANRGRWSDAATHYAAALRAARAVQDDALIGTAALHQGQADMALGRHAAAAAAFEQVMQAPQRYGAALAAQAAARRALLAADQGDAATAHRAADAASHACPTPCEHAAAMDGLRAHLALKAGDLAQAQAWAQQAMAQAGGAERGHALQMWGRVLLARGDAAGAVVSLREATAVHQQHGRAASLAACLRLLAEALQQSGQADAAALALQRAAEVEAAISPPLTNAPRR